MIEDDGRPVRIYKVGGSLFDWPPLFERLDALLRSENARPLLVSGGGGAADVVREWDRVHDLGEERSHRLAVKSLGLGEALLADGLADSRIVSSRSEAEDAWKTDRTPILNVDRFLSAEEAAGAGVLPRTWKVTSDSIAAWVASRWPADLALLKSTSPGTARDPFVDPFFSTFASQVRRVEWIDLRTNGRGDFGSLLSL